MTAHGVQNDVGRDDPVGRNVAILTPAFAVLLAIATILSHRAHTHSVLEKADENDKWTQVQGKKIKLHNRELGRDFVTLLGIKGESADKALEKYNQDIQKYEKESETESDKATLLHASVDFQERRALNYDLAEGFLEVALVVTSLYYISKKMIFPLFGISFGLIGIVLGLYGLILPWLEMH